MRSIVFEHIFEYKYGRAVSTSGFFHQREPVGDMLTGAGRVSVRPSPHDVPSHSETLAGAPSLSDVQYWISQATALDIIEEPEEKAPLAVVT